jgi:hypothetical protein
MIRRIRKDLEHIRARKFHRFDDLDPIIRRCIREYGHLFPNLAINKGGGSKIVYHFNVAELHPISIEREHGSRDSIPRYYAKLIIEGIEDLIAFIESRTEDEEPQAGEHNGDANEDA